MNNLTMTRTASIDPIMSRYLEARYAALMREMREIEALLEMEPKLRATCPDCGKRWNKRHDHGGIDKG